MQNAFLIFDFLKFFCYYLKILDTDNEIENDKKDKKVYEHSYLLVPTLASQDVPAIWGHLMDLVSSFD